MRVNKLLAFPSQPSGKYCNIWRRQEAVSEPVNTITSYAPTIPAEDAAIVPVKHNFEEVFERADFTGIDGIPKNKKVMKDRNGVTMYEDSVRDFGIPDTDFLD
jgi:hypothetical protein